MTVINRVADLLPRPLDPVRSVKLKISILLVASGGAGLVYLWFQYRWLPPTVISVATFAIVLLTAQVLAHGMTRPLRAMTAATRAMAQGDYSRRVRATSRDEVGQLAVAFNQMAADLAAADQQRRELIANVSHELRTPIAALQCVLENLVDGVATPDPATLSTALSQTQRLGRLVTELLDLSRIDAGAAALDPDDVGMAGLLGEAVAEAEITARVAGRSVVFATDVEPPDLVRSCGDGPPHASAAALRRPVDRTSRAALGDRARRRRGGRARVRGGGADRSDGRRLALGRGRRARHRSGRRATSTRPSHPGFRPPRSAGSPRRSRSARSAPCGPPNGSPRCACWPRRRPCRWPSRDAPSRPCA